jgi:peptidyl-prolyl cis-trans isomerase C
MPSLRGLAPLAVFLLLGLGVFALDRWRDDGGAAAQTIEVTPEQLAGIQARWSAQWDRPPTEQELAGLVDDAVKEEVLYREALRLGLDRDDTIVRRRLAQKMTFMLEDGAAVLSPTDAEVEAYHAARRERYLEPRRTTFVHVFLSDDRRADPVGDAGELLGALERGDGERWRQLGDPFMLLREYAERSDQEIGELFGGPFADALADLPPHTWRGPIRSAYGTHLVRVVARTEPRTPPLDEVRAQVVEDLVADRRREQNDMAFEELRARYDVRMPAASAAGLP